MTNGAREPEFHHEEDPQKAAHPGHAAYPPRSFLRVLRAIPFALFVSNPPVAPGSTRSARRGETRRARRGSSEGRPPGARCLPTPVLPSSPSCSSLLGLRVKSPRCLGIDTKCAEGGNTKSTERSLGRPRTRGTVPTHPGPSFESFVQFPSRSSCQIPPLPRDRHEVRGGGKHEEHKEDSRKGTHPGHGAYPPRSFLRVLRAIPFAFSVSNPPVAPGSTRSARRGETR